MVSTGYEFNLLKMFSNGIIFLFEIIEIRTQKVIETLLHGIERDIIN